MLLGVCLVYGFLFFNVLTRFSTLGIFTHQHDRNFIVPFAIDTSMITPDGDVVYLRNIEIGYRADERKAD